MEQSVYDPVIFLHYESICNIRTIVKQMKDAAKITLVHIDPANGFAAMYPSVYLM